MRLNVVDAKSTILESGDFLPPAEIAALADYSAKNPSAQPNKWKKDRAIFAQGQRLFPDVCARCGGKLPSL